MFYRVGEILEIGVNEWFLQGLVLGPADQDDHQLYGQDISHGKIWPAEQGQLQRESDQPDA
ncbi:hypothetical protein AXA74_05330 [Bordetella hinzii LMG 13501]|nr:hypothetical protein AXA74_05330 [Bordetella hinzii LMG 13501]